ncbi:MAG: hypothetical protein QW701_06775 [Candidatus Nezhaarchaeales archaeon]
MKLKSLLSGAGLILLSIVIGVITATPLIFTVNRGFLNIHILARMVGNDYALARALLFWVWTGSIALTTIVIAALAYLVRKIIVKLRGP